MDGFSSPICCCGAEMAVRYDAPAMKKVEPSPEVMVLLKLLAELHGFDLVDKSARGRAQSDQAGPVEQSPESSASSEAPGEASRPLPLEQVRDLHIQRVVEMCGGNRARAAQMLGISRNSLYRTLKRIGQPRRQRPFGEPGSGEAPPADNEPDQGR